jgi:hypothetical protein
MWGGLNLMQIVRTQLDRCPANILLQPVQLGRAGDRGDPGLLRQKPRNRDLRRRRVFARCDVPHGVDQALIGLAVLLREARHDVAEVALVEARVVGDGSRKKALAERAEGHEADAQLLEQRQDFFFPLANQKLQFRQFVRNRQPESGMSPPDYSPGTPSAGASPPCSG